MNGAQPRVREVTDQTVWFFQYSLGGYLVGDERDQCRAGVELHARRRVGAAPGGAVKLSFAPLGGADASPPTIGDGSLVTDAEGPAFLMQMTSGTATTSATHWATMRQVVPGEPEWSSLPGYPETGVPDLTGLQTAIDFTA